MHYSRLYLSFDDNVPRWNSMAIIFICFHVFTMQILQRSNGSTFTDDFRMKPQYSLPYFQINLLYVGPMYVCMLCV
jgi:hypothetical protein